MQDTLKEKAIMQDTLSQYPHCAIDMNHSSEKSLAKQPNDWRSAYAQVGRSE
jgi:hypothetical protein